MQMRDHIINRALNFGVLDKRRWQKVKTLEGQYEYDVNDSQSGSEENFVMLLIGSRCLGK